MLRIPARKSIGPSFLLRLTTETGQRISFQPITTPIESRGGESYIDIDTLEPTAPNCEETPKPPPVPHATHAAPGEYERGGGKNQSGRVTISQTCILLRQSYGVLGPSARRLPFPPSQQPRISLGNYSSRRQQAPHDQVPQNGTTTISFANQDSSWRLPCAGFFFFFFYSGNGR